jgi:hypothetical protein
MHVTGGVLSGVIRRPCVVRSEGCLMPAALQEEKRIGMSYSMASEGSPLERR